MPSPFPGMNPYLERPEVFHDFHQTCMPIIRELLNAQLVPHFFAGLEVDLYIHELPAEQRRLVGRADVAARGLSTGVPTGASGASAVREAPLSGTLPLAVDELKMSVVEIKDRASREVVTVIEMLSPSNKYAGSDRDKYLQKRHRLSRTQANLVEIDLLRGGPRLPLDGMPDCDYCALIGRATKRPEVGIWPIRLRERLPVIEIPLRDPHPDASLDLQVMLDLAYDRSLYAHEIYNGRPDPILRPPDADWAKQFLQEVAR